MRLCRWLRERFRPAEVPQGWDVESLAEIRPHFEPTIEVIDLVTDELGQWAPELAEPVRPVFFDQLRDLFPVDLSWRPSWTVTLPALEA